jgi:16S rRNA (uracil1498-N3)-methyltransferase
MPRVFLPPELLAGESVTIEGEAQHYLTRVLRLERGDTLVVFDGQGTEIDARVEATSSRTTTLALGKRREVRLTTAAITLLQAVPKGERMELVVQKATELGVVRIQPVVTSRSVVQPGADGRLKRWRTIAQEAARQCGRAEIPVIDEPRALGDALEEQIASPSARLLVWEAAVGAPLRRALAGDEPAVTLLVGPEGGLSAPEAASAVAAGFRAVGLGPRILRSETAAIVAVALVQAAVGGLD